MNAALVALAHEAASHWNGALALRFIVERENAVFNAKLPGGPAALRIHRRGNQTEDAIRSELWWMEALADAKLRVPRPMRTRDDTLMARLRDGRFASALTWIDGKPLNRTAARPDDDPAGLTNYHHKLGRLLAEIHTTTDRLALPPAFQRPRWDIEGLLGESPLWGRFWEHPALQADEASVLNDARAALRHALADFAAAGADQGLIHADVLSENVLCKDDRLTLIDFDDCGHGFRLYDLGTVLSEHLNDPHLSEIHAALVEGYAGIRPLDDRERGMIPAFTLARCLVSVGWTMPRLDADDPRHRARIERAVALSRKFQSREPLFG